MGTSVAGFVTCQETEICYSNPERDLGTRYLSQISLTSTGLVRRIGEGFDRDRGRGSIVEDVENQMDGKKATLY